MNKMMIGAAAAAFVLTACEGTGLSQNQAYGAGGGALAGAALGTLAGGDDGRNAAIGAAVGALAGGAVGTYMDRQERALRERTANSQIQVERQGDQIALTMPSNSSVNFAVNSAELQASAYGPLNEIAGVLQEYPSTRVDVVGHASSDGPDDYNMRLSEQRANTVANYFVSRGVEAVRISAYGRGETQPIASNETQAGRAANRRVEVLLTPVTTS